MTTNANNELLVAEKETQFNRDQDQLNKYSRLFYFIAIAI